jgi:hypothetical protein
VSGKPPPCVDDLLRDARAARLALHDLIDRMRRDRGGWKHDRSQLPDRSRLTAAQRQRLRDSVETPRRH